MNISKCIVLSKSFPNVTELKIPSISSTQIWFQIFLKYTKISYKVVPDFTEQGLNSRIQRRSKV